MIKNFENHCNTSKGGSGETGEKSYGLDQGGSSGGVRRGSILDVF